MRSPWHAIEQCAHSPYIPLIVIPLRIPIFLHFCFSTEPWHIPPLQSQLLGRFHTPQAIAHFLILLIIKLKAKYPS